MGGRTVGGAGVGSAREYDPFGYDRGRGNGVPLWILTSIFLPFYTLVLRPVGGNHPDPGQGPEPAFTAPSDVSSSSDSGAGRSIPSVWVVRVAGGVIDWGDQPHTLTTLTRWGYARRRLFRPSGVGGPGVTGRGCLYGPRSPQGSPGVLVPRPILPGQLPMTTRAQWRTAPGASVSLP